MASGPPASAARGARPREVTMAGVVLIVLGALTVLVNGAALLISLSEGEFLEIEATALFLGLTVFGVLLGAAAIASGIGVLRQRAAWRIAGIIVAVIGALSALVNLILGAGRPIAIILLIFWIQVVIALVRSGAAFAGPATGPGPPVGAPFAVPPGPLPQSTAGVPAPPPVAPGPAALPPAAGAPPPAAPGVTAPPPAAPPAGAVLAPPAARATGSPLGPILALAGAALVLVALMVPVAADFRLLAPEAVPFSFWFWRFLEAFGLVIAAGVVAAMALPEGATRLHAGILLGLGAAGVLSFTDFLWDIVSGAPFGPGTLVGMVGAGLIAGGGLTLALGIPPADEGPSVRVGPVLALAGAGLILLSLIAPVAGGLGLGNDIEVGPWLRDGLVLFGVILLAAVAAIVALGGAARRFPGGLLMGAGIVASLWYLDALGFGATVGTVQPTFALGLVGAGLLIAGGAVAASLPARSPVGAAGPSTKLG